MPISLTIFAHLKKTQRIFFRHRLNMVLRQYYESDKFLSITQAQFCGHSAKKPFTYGSISSLKVNYKLLNAVCV